MSLQLDRRSEELRLRVVRRPLRHDSSPKHVAGSATFVDDIREPEGLLHIAVGGTHVASGQLLGVDLDAVRAAPGVVAVLTAKDIPGKNDVGPVLHDDPIFVDSRIDFYGQVVFAVVAKTRGEARRAAKLAKVEASVGTHCVSVDDALAADSHILPDYTFRKDDSAAALAQSAYRVKGRLRIGGQEHFYLEGQVSLAIPGEDGDMTVYTSTQHPSEMQHLVAGMLNVPVVAVTVEVRRMGGAFGGKETQAAQWAAIAALGARVTGKPCKIRLDRDDDMCLTGKRHDFLSDYEVGFDVDGRIQALDTVMASRCGYSADVSGAINDRAMFHADNAYYLPAATITTKRMKTNTVSNTAFRGFGGPQGMMVAERAIDEIAWALGIDPLDVRKRNLYGEGRDVTPYGMVVEDNILPALIDRCEATSDYRARRRKIAAFNAESATLKRGLALTPVKFGISFTTTHLNQAGALVHVYQDGSIHLNHGGTEMGQGLYVKVAQVVAEEFGVDLDKVKITATTTAKVPNTSATAASSGSDINGWAAKNAAGAIKARLIVFAAESYEVASDQIEFRDNRVFIGNQSVPFAELIRKAYMARVSLSSTGFYKTPKIHWDAAKGQGRPFFYFSYGAACSEVLVDVTTGEMKVQRVDILHDVGRSLNPAVDIGQIEGGFVQGMGWLTTEELVFHADGRLLSHAPSTYKIPCASDVPEHFEIALWDGANREDTIHRSKAVGEPPLMLAISVFAAIADAIHSLNPAVPVPLDAPATPEAILRAVQAVS
ncbi:MAG: xanthine dehydrogenase large subunit [Hyphomicrobiales bacterium]|jgi:xanthine dehydrogenase large subunit|nr:xanthine dehydrogenase large subunit [Hyphomicrobiales bacterium]